MQIANHAFLVTGGGSGLGAATARMLVANGGKVVIADVNDAAATRSRRSWARCATFVKTDVTDEASTQAAVDLCVAHFGAIHGAINCAGVATGRARRRQRRPARRSRASSAW